MMMMNYWIINDDDSQLWSWLLNAGPQAQITEIKIIKQSNRKKKEEQKTKQQRNHQKNHFSPSGGEINQNKTEELNRRRCVCVCAVGTLERI